MVRHQPASGSGSRAPDALGVATAPARADAPFEIARYEHLGSHPEGELVLLILSIGAFDPRLWKVGVVLRLLHPPIAGGCLGVLRDRGPCR